MAVVLQSHHNLISIMRLSCLMKTCVCLASG